MSAPAKRRSGFSLMEMVIATAVLAGSGVALFALVGQASRLARKAEERTVALQMAQTTLDEFLASGSDAEQETEGSFESDPRWSYRIEQSSVATESSVATSGQTARPLKKIVVFIHRANHGSGASANAADSAVVRLVRWSQGPQSAETLSAETPSSGSSGDLEPPAPAGSVPETLRSP